MTNSRSIVHPRKPQARGSGDIVAQLAFIRTLLLYLVVFKFESIRVWPHSYAGEFYAPSRIVYYAEFFVTLMSVFVACIHVGIFREIFHKYRLITLFLITTLMAGLFNISAGLGSFLYGFGYIELFFAITIVMTIDGERKLLTVVMNSGSIFLLLNFLSLAVPSISFMIADFSGVFRGLTPHRNDLSHISAIFLIIAIFYGKYTLLAQRMANAFIAVIMIVLAKSAQGVVLSLICCSMWVVFRLPMSVRRVAIVTMAISAAIIVFFTVMMPSEVEAIFGFFGRDTTFTGRDRIWSMSVDLLAAMPFYGYGLGSISSDILSSSILKEYGLGIVFGSAHNAYLEAFLAYGWFGGSVFAVIALGAAVSMVRVFWSSRDQADHLGAVLLLFALVGGITSSEKLFFPNFGWLTLVLATGLIRRPRRNSSYGRGRSRQTLSYLKRNGRRMPNTQTLFGGRRA